MSLGVGSYKMFGPLLLGQLLLLLLMARLPGAQAQAGASTQGRGSDPGRRRVSINTGWRFRRFVDSPDGLAYDRRPDMANRTGLQLLKPWILPSGNEFVADPADRHQRPTDDPPAVPFAQDGFDDSSWEAVRLPHDWAIQGPFYTGDNPVVGGGMGRLPVQGVAWYRRKLALPAAAAAAASDDEGASVYLEVDGAMSYAMVWLDGQLVGGWPYGYSSFRLDLTPFVRPGGGDHQLAIRLDNPVDSSRWYPGGGLYRNVWITTVAAAAHVAQWGTFVTARDVSRRSATLDLALRVENSGARTSQTLRVATDVHVYDAASQAVGEKVTEFPRAQVRVAAGQTRSLNSSVRVASPQLWGPPPSQTPNLYAAVTRLYASDGRVVDSYTTPFGIRSVAYDADRGLLVNGEHVRIQGVNQHHDLGALGAAFHARAAERQLATLRDLGCNAVRTSHNPPAPELLDLADRMGFLVLDEAFDCWEMPKTTNDFHLLFPDWHEPDLRALVRRDRNHPSVVIWSIGNEVGEQTSGAAGAELAARLRAIVRAEDSTRPVAASMNAARPDMPFPAALDLVSLNYQGEGIRDTPAYANLSGSVIPPQYPPFHAALPDKMVFETESSATLSTRGTYLFPVTPEWSAPERDDVAGGGGDPARLRVSAYELYTAPFGASPDKVFATQDNHSFVAGEFVWSGWDYLGEPTPYYGARSSYYGLVDLAGFRKDRFYLYQARWRPDLRTAHILPHWTWPADRAGQVTPVHVFSAADEAELFLNGRSLGARTRPSASSFRFRWDDVAYEPGELRVVTYKDGREWARDSVRTAGPAARLQLTAEEGSRALRDDGADLAFVRVEVQDGRGQRVPTAADAVTFSVSGPGQIVATDNGDPASLVSFASETRAVFGGLGLVIVRASGGGGDARGRHITVTADADGLASASVTLTVQK